jgi:uncharacterized protein YdeI (BOF family)
MRKTANWVIVFVLMVSAAAVSAQDATTTPTGDATMVTATPMAGTDGTAMLIPTTLEEVTANRTAFDSQTVILEGFIDRFLSVDTFVLGENVGIDNDQVLVINNTGRAFPRDLFAGANVVITGLVRPPYNDVASGAMSVDTTPVGEMSMDADLMFMNEMNTGYTSYGLYYGGFFPETYFGYTVIEVTDVATIAFVPSEG